jgi:hypothetical protein
MILGMGKKSRLKRERREKITGPDGLPVTCYLCGERPSNTVDHVPPQGLFPSNVEFRGFEVPACKQCNNDFSKDDEYFRDILTMGCTNDDALQVLQEKTIPSMKRPWAQLQLVRKEDRIAARAFPVAITSPSGLHLKTRVAFQFDTERMNKVCERIARGIYYEIAKEPLAKACEITATLLRPAQANEFVKELQEQQGEPNFGRVAGDTFLYAVWGLPEDRYMTGLWILRFYDEITGIVIIKGPAALQAASQASHDALEDPLNL